MCLTTRIKTEDQLGGGCEEAVAPTQRSLATRACKAAVSTMQLCRPPALHQLSRLHITYPVLFKLIDKNSARMTHCGGLEFVADEGIATSLTG